MDIFDNQLVDLSSPHFTGDQIYAQQHSNSMSTCTTYTQTTQTDPRVNPERSENTLIQPRTVSFSDLAHRQNQGALQTVSTPKWEPLSVRQFQGGEYPTHIQSHAVGDSVRQFQGGEDSTHIQSRALSDSVRQFQGRGYPSHMNSYGIGESIRPADYYDEEQQYFQPFNQTNSSYGDRSLRRTHLGPLSYTAMSREPDSDKMHFQNPSTLSQPALHNMQGPQNITGIGGNYVSSTRDIGKSKVFEPETFKGDPDGTEWSEYIIHFEMISELNEWTEFQKTKVLLSKLRGKAQTILSSLTYSQCNDYCALKKALTQRFNPEEREIAHRCEFKNRRRQKDEQPADFGYALQRLGRKAYPGMPYSSLEVHILDQFIMGLGCFELQKHVQFHHPKTLEQAINLATEYTAMCKNLDRITKPNLSEERDTTNIVDQRPLLQQVNSLRPKQPQKVNVSEVEGLEELMKRVVQQSLRELNLPNNTERGRSPVRNYWANNDRFTASRGGKPRVDNSYQARDAYYDRGSPGPRKIRCSYCGRDNHVESRCWVKQRDMNNQQTQSKQPLN